MEECFVCEPKLDDLLRDPVIHLLMARDRVEMGDLRRLLDEQREVLRRRPVWIKSITGLN